ncbi:MAG TPA: hypothetical protein DCS67_00050 [Clostridiales bacterium UBA8960]|jgi:histidinol-phosphatase (PHP family)|nr:hypothetical protein [Clostridiales bacterium UBA8960]
MKRIDKNALLKTDFHTHSNFSPDSKASMETMVVEAINRKITDLAFTDHVDLDADLEVHGLDWDFDRSNYEKSINELNGTYGEKIRIYQGIEIGIQPHLAKANTAIIQESAFDFVIGSVHSVERRDLYHRKFFDSHSDKEAVRIYFEEMYESVKSFDALSVLGHLDLYKRYKPELGKIKLNEYQEIVEEIFKHLIQNGKGIEINSGGHRYGLDQNNPSDQLLKLYKEMNGEVITLGSDAHGPEFLAYKYEENIEKIKAMGFKYICTFNKMKPIFHKI